VGQTSHEVAPLVVTPVAGSIGAQIDGLDLREPLSDEQVSAVHDALMRHLVVFFRDQDLSDEQHLAFASRFGAPNVYPATRARGLEEPIEWIEDTPDSPPKADLWHTDAAFLAEPPDIAVLNMRVVPPVGGDTLWVNLYEVHDALSPAMQHAIADLELDLHPGEFFEEKITLQFGHEVYERIEHEFRGAHHPLVRVHPVTGRRALYMCGAYVRGIVDMHPHESEVLLWLLREGLGDPNFQCRWHYREHDVVMWDERCTNHRAVGDHFPHRRLVRRCTVGAGKPIGPGAARQP